MPKDIEKSVKNAAKSLNVEGMYPTKEEMKNVKDRQSGLISEKEFIEKAKEIARKGAKEND